MRVTIDQTMQNLIRERIAEKTADPYAGTLFEGWVYMHQLNRGLLGEEIVKTLLMAQGRTVSKPGHTRFDAIVDEHAVEIKTAISVQGKWNINHIRTTGEWDRLILLLIDTDASVSACWLTKAEVLRAIELGHFHRQSGGRAGNNDDWKCSNAARMIEEVPAHGLTEWN